MLWANWEPIYARILDDFGYSRAADEEARDLLAALARDRARVDLDALRASVRGRNVVIAGPATEKHEDALDEPAGSSAPRSAAAKTRSRESAPTIATDAASWAFDDAIAIVTDLDGDVDAQIASGAPMFVHAHGDNMDALRRWVPRIRAPMCATTQAAPVAGVENFGGFTDGDRACCLAVELGAASLSLVGFDFEHPEPKPGRDAGTKARKLRWAERIIHGLGVPVRAA